MYYKYIPQISSISMYIRLYTTLMLLLIYVLCALDSPDVLAAPVLTLVNATTVKVMWSQPANANRETLNILYYMVRMECDCGEGVQVIVVKVQGVW